jgi:hypothetical protein
VLLQTSPALGSLGGSKDTQRTLKADQVLLHQHDRIRFLMPLFEGSVSVSLVYTSIQLTAQPAAASPPLLLTAGPPRVASLKVRISVIVVTTVTSTTSVAPKVRASSLRMDEWNNMETNERLNYELRTQAT